MKGLNLLSEVSAQSSRSRQERLIEEASVVANIMETEGNEAALNHASAHQFLPDADYLLARACGVLFQTGDPARQEHAFNFMEWDAENAPSMKAANEISYTAQFDAREDDQRAFAERFFKISILNIRHAIASEDLEPTDDFFDNMRSALIRIQESGYGALYHSAIQEFTPFILKSAEQWPEQTDGLSTDQKTRHDFERENLDDLLMEAYHHAEPNSELAQNLRRSIVGENNLMLLDDADRDTAFLGHLKNGNFNEAKAVLATELPIGTNVWALVFKRLFANFDKSSGWSNDVIDAILEAIPEAFVTTRGWTDFRLGRTAGKVLGMLDRTQEIDQILTLHDETDDPFTRMQTVAGIAQGYGYVDNEAGYTAFFDKLHDKFKTDEMTQALRQNFDFSKEEAKKN